MDNPKRKRGAAPEAEEPRGVRLAGAARELVHAEDDMRVMDRCFLWWHDIGDERPATLHSQAVAEIIRRHGRAILEETAALCAELRDALERI